MNNNPIGIFDSGLGGLTVWREVRRQLLNEDVVYFADSRNCPYGPKSADEIVRLARTIVDGLLEKGCKLIVVACNTATAAAIDTLRSEYDVPFVGMEPAIKQAALHTRTGKVGVLATKGTFNGRLYKATSQKYARDIEVMVQIGDGLVELVEANEYNGPKARPLLEKYINPMLESGVDQIVLGCTHYPFFKPQIEALTGPQVTVIDPAPAVARHAADLLAANNLQAAVDRRGSDIFVSSGDAGAMAVLLASMTGRNFERGMLQMGCNQYDCLR